MKRYYMDTLKLCDFCMMKYQCDHEIAGAVHAVMHCECERTGLTL